MSLKDKITNTIVGNPKLLTFGIGMAVTFVIATALGIVDHSQVFATISQHNHAD